MKNLYFLFLAGLLFVANTICAQTVTDFPDVSTLAPETLFQSTIDPLFAGLTVVFGYVSAYIPGVKRLSPFYRVLAFALAAGLGFHLFGASFWKIASSYLFASGLYLTILKNILPSPKASKLTQAGA